MKGYAWQDAQNVRHPTERSHRFRQCARQHLRRRSVQEMWQELRGAIAIGGPERCSDVDFSTSGHVTKFSEVTLAAIFTREMQKRRPGRRPYVPILKTVLKALALAGISVPQRVCLRSP